jgi:hypothetical protein
MDRVGRMSPALLIAFAMGLAACSSGSVTSATTTITSTPPPTRPATSTTRPAESVVTGIAEACEGAVIAPGTILDVTVRLVSGHTLVVAEMVRTGRRYCFSVAPGVYHLNGWWGSTAVAVRAGEVVTVNFPNNCI